MKLIPPNYVKDFEISYLKKCIRLKLIEYDFNSNMILIRLILI